jgi:deoxyribonuclease V
MDLLAQHKRGWRRRNADTPYVIKTTCLLYEEVPFLQDYGRKRIVSLFPYTYSADGTALFSMFLALDVGYPTDDTAKAVAITFEQWQDTTPTAKYIAHLNEVAPYVPGAFYQRELPCLLAVLAQVDPNTIHTIIVDGYVTLDDEGKPGLGAHLYTALGNTIPVIGVAKRPFHANRVHVRPVLRGGSQQPLFVTTTGTDVDRVAHHVSMMAGSFRLPTLLKTLDTLTKRSE